MSGSARPLLARLALHRPELRAWAMYDWANSAMVTIVVTAIFPIFFARVAYVQEDGPSAAQVHAWATTISLIFIALLAPLLGIVADRTRSKKKLLLLFASLGVIACAGMFFIRPGEWQLAAGLFMLANIGASGSFVFYDALLPHVAREDEMDQLSTSAFALGYLGGGLLLALNLAWIREPAWFGLPSGEGISAHEASLPARLAFLSVAIWWALFSIPLLRRVQEPAGVSFLSNEVGAKETAPSLSFGRAFLMSFGALRGTFRDLRRYPQAALMLLAFMIFNDGITTFIRMASVYGEELKLDPGQMMLALLLVQFLGVPCTFLFGWVASKVGAKRSVIAGLGVYCLVGVLARGLQDASDFFVMASLIALVQGGTQALSRSLFASMIPAQKSGEFFGFFAVFDRFAGVLGPLLFASVLAWTGDIRDAVMPLLAFFVIGAALLSRVRVEEGRRAARE